VNTTVDLTINRVPAINHETYQILPIRVLQINSSSCNGIFVRVLASFPPIRGVIHASTMHVSFRCCWRWFACNARHRCILGAVALANLTSNGDFDNREWFLCSPCFSEEDKVLNDSTFVDNNGGRLLSPWLP
jgi:hypothetical protein